MPTVLRIRGYRVAILLPPREHGPPHVHVTRGGGTAVVTIPAGGAPVRVRTVAGLRDAEVVRACRIVEEHAELLLQHWRRHHG